MPQFSPTNYEGRDRLSHVEDFLQNKSDTVQRNYNAANTRGILGEAYHLSGAATTGGTQSATSTQNSSIVGFRAGDVVSNIICLLTSEGASMTIAKTVLLDSAGNLLAQSANLSTAFSTTSVAGTLVVGALSSAYTVPTDGGYYCGFVSVGNGIGPKLGSASVVTGVGKQIGSGARLHTRSTNTSDAGSWTLLDSSTAFWFAAS